MATAYRKLLRALRQARAVDRHPRCNPVPRSWFQQHRMDDTLLLWLLYKQPAEHVQTVPGRKLWQKGQP